MEMGVGSGMEGVNERCAPHTPLRSGFFMPPIVWGEILSSRGQRESRCPHFFLFRTGVACMPHVTPVFCPFRMGAAYVAPISCFKRGRRMSPHFLFRTGAAYVAPCLSFSNGGGVHATRRPHFFPFQTGAVCMPHVAPYFFPFRTEAA
jgi:hypothetical protein